MTIFIDAMGGDNAPREIIKGALLAQREYNADITLIGDTDTVNPILDELSGGKTDMTIIDAKEVITMDEEPVAAIRKKKNSSMVIGALKAKEDKKNAFISAGSTGALLASALFYTGRIKGVARPAMCTLIFNGSDKIALIDNGANADCKAEYFVQFAKLGSAYYSAATGTESPKVGLLNIGTEDIKGNQLYKEAHLLLKETEGINFIGNIEANALLSGKAQVVVCDGFTGNVLLKSMEGSFGFVLSMLKKVLIKSAFTKIAAAIIKKDLSAQKSLLDPKAYGGVPFLGVDGIVIKAHGNSDAFAVKNAVKQAIELVNADVLDKIKETL